MNAYSLPAVVAFTVNLTLGLLVLLSDPRSERHRWFASLIFAFSAWNLVEALIIASPDASRARILSYILYRFVYLMPAFFLVFVAHIATQRRSWLRSKSFALLVLGFPIFLLFVSRKEFPIQLLIVNSRPLAYYYSVQVLATPFAVLLNLTAVSYLGFSFALLLRCRHRARSSRQRRQITSILVGYPAFFILFLTSWFLSPFRRTALQLYMLGTGFTMLVSASLWISAREYGLLRVTRLLAGGLAFTIFSAPILAFYLLVLRSLSAAVASTFGIHSPVIDVALVLALAVVVRPAERTLQNLLEQAFRRGVRGYRHRLLELFDDLLDYRGRQYLVERTCRFVNDNFAARNCAFLLPLKDDGQFSVWTPEGATEIRFHLPASFRRKLVQLGRPLESAEFDEIHPPSDLAAHLRSENAEVIVPLWAQKTLLGLLYFGWQSRSGGLDEESIEMIRVLGDELSVTLARNLLIERVETRQREQAQADRVDALRRLLAGVAHEVRNPLNTIATASETLSRHPDNPDVVQEMAEIISAEAERMDKLLTDFLRLQKVRNPEPRRVDLQEVLDRALLGVTRGRQANVHFDLNVGTNCQHVLVDDNLLEQLVLNLVNNAVEAVAASEGATDDPRVAVRVRCENHSLTLEVQDNGPGIPAEIRDRIFDPFFTTKSEGTGLGLAIVHNILNVMGGDIQVDSRAGKTVFTVKLPVETNHDTA